MLPIKNEVGNKYGMLTVIKPYGSTGNGYAWLCKCDCGMEIAVKGTALRFGNTRSCGCLVEMPFAERLERGLAPHGKERVVASTTDC